MTTEKIANGSVTHDKLSTGVQNQLSGMEDRLDKLDAGVAMALAFASVPSVPGKTLSMGFGVGSFNDEEAAAIKFSYTPVGENYAITAGGTVASGGDTGGAVGIAFGL